jgi:hypothetical protein
MESLQSVKESFINQLENSFSTIYTKENVLKLLEKYTKKIEEISDNKSNEKYTFDEIRNAIINYQYDAFEFVEIDYDSAEFSIGSGNQIELDSINLQFNNRWFFDKLEDNLKDN